jgi:hypothetical protein
VNPAHTPPQDTSIARNPGSPAPRPPGAHQRPQGGFSESSNGSGGHHTSASGAGGNVYGLASTYDPLEEEEAVHRQHNQGRGNSNGYGNNNNRQLGAPQYMPAPVQELDLSDLRSFLMQPGPMNGPVLCYIVRDKGSAKMYPKVGTGGVLSLALKHCFRTKTFTRRTESWKRARRQAIVDSGWDRFGSPHSCKSVMLIHDSKAHGQPWKKQGSWRASQLIRLTGQSSSDWEDGATHQRQQGARSCQWRGALKLQDVLSRLVSECRVTRVLAVKPGAQPLHAQSGRHITHPPAHADCIGSSIDTGDPDGCWHTSHSSLPAPPVLHVLSCHFASLPLVSAAVHLLPPVLPCSTTCSLRTGSASCWQHASARSRRRLTTW